MYEISLVPDVKGEMIKQQKLRNLVFMICVIVAGACVGVILILVSIMGGQTIKLAAQDTEIECRSSGKTSNSSSCDSKFGTAVMNFKNVNELLTLQEQMRNMNLLNSQRNKMSRIFSFLDIILLKGEYEILATDVNFNIEDGDMNFSAVARWSTMEIPTVAVNAFKENAQASYYDTGSYMMPDGSGGYTEIPSFCITEETLSDGTVLGKYHRYAAGCEESMLKDIKLAEKAKSVQEEVKTTSGDENTSTENDENNENGETKKKDEEEFKDEEEITILRSYKSSDEKEACKQGNNIRGKKTDNCTKGYYFESRCIVYGDDGKIDRTQTIANCPIITDTITASSPTSARDQDGNWASSFDAIIPVNTDIFIASNHHVIIYGPTRQNVTDSYVQVRDMFTERISE